MAQWKIRKAVNDEIEQVGSLYLRLYGKEETSYLDVEPYPWPFVFDPAVLSAWITAEKGDCFVALDESDKVAGAVWLMRRGVNVYSIDLLGVLPERRSAGLGKALVAGCLRHLDKEHFYICSAEAVTSRKGSLELFSSLGFKTTGLSYGKYPPLFVKGQRESVVHVQICGGSYYEDLKLAGFSVCEQDLPEDSGLFFESVKPKCLFLPASYSGLVEHIRSTLFPFCKWEINPSETAVQNEKNISSFAACKGCGQHSMGNKLAESATSTREVLQEVSRRIEAGEPWISMALNLEYQGKEMIRELEKLGFQYENLTLDYNGQELTVLLRLQWSSPRPDHYKERSELVSMASAQLDRLN